jgi:TonB family protein
MPLIQIPFQDPVAPPKQEPEQLGLYDTRGWETAYRDLDDARVPHLLIQLQDDLTRSRRREAAWISIIVHIIIIIIVLNFARLMKYLPLRSVVVVSPSDVTRGKDVTFLTLPPDLQKLTQRTKSNIISDKDRVAMSRHPELDPKELKKVLATPPPGRPGPSGPRTPQPEPAAPAAMAQNNSQPPQPQDVQRPASDPNRAAQLQTQATNTAPPQVKFGGESMSPGSAIQQAARAAATTRGGGGGQGGDFGLGTGAKGRQVGNLEVLSDTQGVDFGPYLARILQDVRENWYRLIPESAAMKKGKLGIEFAITKDGKVAGMKLVTSSGDVALDRAAWGGITASNPFPPLPSDFTGQYLALRFRFFYNPDKGEME